MVTVIAYKIIKKAVILRISFGEDVIEILNSYPKLSDSQRAKMLVELAEEGIIEGAE